MKNLSQIAIFSLIIENPVYKAIKSYCVENNIQYMFESEIDNVKDAIENMVDSKSEDTWGLLIFDDFTELNNGSRSNPYAKVINTASAMLRNYQFHIIQITQSPLNIGTICRNNANLRVLFRVSDRYALE